jgi:hypothetical protein
MTQPKKPETPLDAALKMAMTAPASNQGNPKAEINRLEGIVEELRAVRADLQERHGAESKDAIDDITRQIEKLIRKIGELHFTRIAGK